MPIQHNYIDIFAGCGGLSVGLYNAGWKGLFAIEKNPDAFSTLKYNLIDTTHHFVWEDWLSVDAHDINALIHDKESELKALRGTVQLVAGGPPCQGFSMAGKRNKDDLRNTLVDSYIQFISLVKPEAIIFENVHGFTVNFKDEGGSKKYSIYVEDELKKLGYNAQHRIIDMSDFGVPQKRRRFILVALLHHNPADVFSKLFENKNTFCLSKNISTTTSVYDALSDLEEKHGLLPSPDSKNFSAGVYGLPESNYQKLMRLGIDETASPVDSHRFVQHRQDTINLHKKLQAEAPRGKRLRPNNPWVPEINRRGVTVLDPKSQAPTITSIPDELVHYSEPRILTVREQARLQSFPDWYKFKGRYTSGGPRRKQEVPRYTQVGNAVPPLFAEQIGIALLQVLNNE